ncbi:hypothetical protein Esti_006234 [Eimeria stiedai]
MTLFLTSRFPYCVGKCLVSYPLVLRESGEVAVLEAASGAPRAALPPKDFAHVVGLKLPSALYVHLACGLLSRDLAAALAQGDWIEPFEPAADSQELGDVYKEVVAYRRKALGLVTKCLHPKYQQRGVVFARAATGAMPSASGMEALPPETSSSCIGRNWTVSPAAVAAELQRQRKQKVDLGFCLQWVATASDAERRRLLGDPAALPAAAAAAPAAAAADMESNALLAAALLQLLDAASLFTEEGDSTVFGSALAEVPHDFQEDVLVCLELLKLGLLTGEPLEAPAGAPYPKGLMEELLQPVRGFVAEGAGDTDVQRAALLLQRVASLLQLQHKPGSWWASDVCLDLRGFCCISAALKTALRQLAEASLLHQILKNPKARQRLPPPAARVEWLPLFPTSGCCLGLVMRFFLRYEGAGVGGPSGGAAAAPSAVGGGSGDPLQQGGPLGGGGLLSTFEAAVRGAYPTAEDPVGDLCRAIRFWRVVQKVLGKISLSVDVSNLLPEVELADALLESRIGAAGLRAHPAFPKP